MITYEKNRHLHEVVREIPLERVLLETDSPYFLPRQEPNSQSGISHPGYVIHTAAQIALLKNVPIEGKIMFFVRQNCLPSYQTRIFFWKNNTQNFFTKTCINQVPKYYFFAKILFKQIVLVQVHTCYQALFGETEKIFLFFKDVIEANRKNVQEIYGIAIRPRPLRIQSKQESQGPHFTGQPMMYAPD